MAVLCLPRIHDLRPRHLFLHFAAVDFVFPETRLHGLGESKRRLLRAARAASQHPVLAPDLRQLPNGG